MKGNMGLILCLIGILIAIYGVELIQNLQKVRYGELPDFRELEPSSQRQPIITSEVKTNLISNPGFEEYWVDSRGVVQTFSWGLPSRPEGKFSIDITEAHSGQASGKLEHYEYMEPTKHPPICYQLIPKSKFKPSTTYQLSFWYKSSNNRKVWTEILFEESISGKVVKSYYHTWESSTDWIKTDVFVFQSPSQGEWTNWNDVYFGVMMIEGLVGTAHLDDFELVEA